MALLFQDHTHPPKNALTAATYVRLHTQEDQKVLFRGYYEAIGLVVAASIISSQIIPAENATETARRSLTIGLGVASAYLGQFIFETREKLSHLKEKFKNVAGFINDKEHVKLAPMTLKLFKDRENLYDLISFRKHPIRNGLASAFAGSGLMSGDIGLACMGASAAMFTVLLDMFHEEEHANTALNDAATNAKLALLDPTQDILEEIKDSINEKNSPSI